MLVQADARMIPLKSGVVQCVVTSPPYWGLRDYGIKPSTWGGDPTCEHCWEYGAPTSETNYTDKRRWQHTRNGRDELQPPEKRVGWKREAIEHGQFCRCGAWLGVLGLEPTPDLYVEHIVEISRELARVLRDDGTLWLNLGDCYATGAGKVGECPGGGEQGERWKGYRGTRRSGKHDYVDTAMGPLIQPNRMPLAGLKPKDLVGVPWRVAFALQDDGWYLRSDIIWAKPNPMPESVIDRPTKSHEYIFLLTKSKRYFYDAAAIAESATCGRKRGSGPMVQPGTGRNDIGQKGDYRTRKAYDGTGKWAQAQKQSSGRRLAENTSMSRKESGSHDAPFGQTRNARSVWEISTKSYTGAHFATFPREIPERCIKAGSKPGDFVLDPFCGSGTTVMVARDLGRIGIGLDLTYQALAAERIGGSLFKNVINSAWS